LAFKESEKGEEEEEGKGVINLFLEKIGSHKYGEFRENQLGPRGKCTDDFGVVDVEWRIAE
jgi:hypothetical protein